MPVKVLLAVLVLGLITSGSIIIKRLYNYGVVDSGGIGAGAAGPGRGVMPSIPIHPAHPTASKIIRSSAEHGFCGSVAQSWDRNWSH